MARAREKQIPPVASGPPTQPVRIINNGELSPNVIGINPDLASRWVKDGKCELAEWPGSKTKREKAVA